MSDIATGFVKWRGIGDWLIGKVIPGSETYGKVGVERIDGTKVRVSKHSLKPVTHDEIDRAVRAGRCFIPIEPENKYE